MKLKVGIAARQIIVFVEADLIVGCLPWEPTVTLWAALNVKGMFAKHLSS